jgi:hypothetical protein
MDNHQMRLQYMISMHRHRQVTLLIHLNTQRTIILHLQRKALLNIRITATKAHVFSRIKAKKELVNTRILALKKKETRIIVHAARRERKRISMRNLRFTRRQDKIPYSTFNQTVGNGSSIPALYYKYVYVQDMVSADHSLKESLPVHRKMVARSQLHDISLICSQLSFEIGARMFYCSNNLTNRPHGSSLSNTKPATDYQLDIMQIPHASIKTTQIRNPNHHVARVVYPGSSEISLFEQIGLDEKGLVEHVLRRGETPTAAKRDACVGPGIVKRINLGYGQEQGDNSPNSRFLNGHCLPFLDKNCALQEIPGKLHAQIGKVLSLSQELLPKLYPDEHPEPFYDHRRTKLFGKPFASLFFDECTSRFEFVDLYLESQGQLNRRLDYVNDGTPGCIYIRCLVFLSLFFRGYSGVTIMFAP